MRPCRVLLSLSFLSAMLCGADADPVIGKWKLNWKKSHSSEPTPKRVIRQYTASGDRFRVEEEWTRKDGTTEKLDYTARYDGKDYPIATQGGSAIRFNSHDDYVATGVSTANGQEAYSFKRTVSKDGKKLVIETTKTDSAGKRQTDTKVYDKIK